MSRVLTRILIATVSVIVTMTVLELLIIPPLLPRLPLAFQGDLPPYFRVPAQSSKVGTVPQRYIALLGDSYAQGFGDWLMEGGRWRNGPYQASHLIFERCGTDVVSLGASGAGSIRGWVSAPISTLSFLGSTVRYQTVPPDRLFLYFFEGNDLTDNLEDLALRYDPAFDPDRFNDDVYLRDFIDSVGIEGDAVMQLARSGSIWNSSVAVQYLKTALQRRELSSEERLPFEPVRTESGVNTVAFSGGSQDLPVNLQGPPRALTSLEQARALRLAEAALARSRFYFSDIPGTMVYIGSPASLYRFSGTTVRFVDGRKAALAASPAEIRESGDLIAREIGEMAKRAGFQFVDSRPALRAAAIDAPVHGPIDWSHFNRRGYEALAEVLIASLPVGSCSRHSPQAGPGNL